MNFLKKRSQILPHTGISWAQDKSSRAARSAVFRENSKWWCEDSHLTDSSVSGEEGHSTIVLTN